MDVKDILNLGIKDPDFGDKPVVTIKEYLEELLLTLWEEDEGFSGKRPFGNSGWQYDLYIPLVESGVVAGSIDEYGCLDDCDDSKAYKIITQCIKHCFK